MTKRKTFDAAVVFVFGCAIVEESTNARPATVGIDHEDHTVKFTNVVQIISANARLAILCIP